MARRFVMGLALWLAVAAVWAAAPPVPWSAQQKEKLAERDRLEKAANGFVEAKEHDKLIDTIRRIASLESEVLGETAPKTIGSLRWLAEWHEWLSQYDAAVKVREEIQRRQLKRLPRGHWELTDAKVTLEDARRLGGMKEEQRARVRQADDWKSKVGELARQGKAKEGIVLARKVCDVYKEELGERHRFHADGLSDLAMLYRAVGDHAKALALYTQALAIRKEALGDRHPDYANSLNNLASLHRAMGEHAIALPLYVRALDIDRETLGENHPNTAATLNNLALLYKEMGEHARALPLFLQTLDFCNKELGENHLNTAATLNNLALLYKEMGEFARALPLFLRAIDVYKKKLGDRHRSYANCVNNLGALYKEMGEYEKALPLFEKARDVEKEVLGERHPSYAISLNNLALLHKEMGQHDKALPLFTQAHGIFEKALGKRHPSYAISLNNLALLHQDVGEHDKARPLFVEACEISKTTLGERHPSYARSLNNLALLYQAGGKPEEAAKTFNESLAVLQRYLDDCFDHLSERQRNQTLQHVLHRLGIQLSLQEQAERSAAERYSAVLWWKGRVESRSALDRLAAGRPELKDAVGKLRAISTRLARLVQQTPTVTRQADWLEQVRALTEEKEALEAELSKRSTEFRAQAERRGLTARQLAKQLPEGVAFVDLIEYTHYSPPRGGKGKAQQEQRLLGFVSRRDRDVVAVPLGEMKPIAEAVARWREQVQKEPTKADRKAIDASAKVIRARVWDKLSKHLGDPKTVIVSPDGVLCQFPLAALPGSKNGTYLIEEVAVAQVASAAQLFGLLEPAGKDARQGKGLLAVGGIDYGTGKAYGPLPGTEAEATLCRDLFRKSSGDPATLLTGKQASAAALRKKLAERPRFLHLATHGYFEPADKVERLLKGLASRQDADVLRWQQGVTLSNLPGLRCGLALSGANQAPPEDDPDALPNVLTGQDLESMDLRGCEVAVLSACQTALGDVQRSQGVLGLQRALHAAGVRTTVTSLWSVQDAATAELMEEFYRRLWGEKKISRLEALRQAQIAILRDPERVRRRTQTLLADAKKRGVSEDLLRGPKGRFATDLPDGGKLDEQKKPKTSPEAWWAAFVLAGDWR